MKTILFIALSFCSLKVVAQPDGKPVIQTSSIEFKTMLIERPDIAYDSKEPFIFEFTNTGAEPLLITDAHATCGCTTPEKPTGPIAKGESSRLVVNYDTKRVGPFTKTVTVSTNTSEPVVLTIKGNVLPAPVVEGTTPAPATY